MVMWAQAVPNEPELRPQLVAKKKRTVLKNAERWQRILTVASLVMCIAVTLIMVQQQRTIDNQRVLIRQLFQDSLELNQLKVKQFQEQNAAKNKKKEHADKDKQSAIPKWAKPGCDAYMFCG
jgi:hypothetical protein